MKKILIIEDDQIVANAYRNKLTVADYLVEVADNGESGLELIKSFQPDLVLLDLLLPQMSGVDVMKQVRALPEFEKLPIIVFSNTYLSNTIKEAWKAGATKCFSKSNCSPKQILDSVHSLLGAASGEIIAAPQMAKDPPPADAPIKFKMAASAPEAPASDPAQEFAKQFPAHLSTLRALHQTLAKTADEAARTDLLGKMCDEVHLLIGSSGLAGHASLARLADALEALLREIHEKPATFNPSTLRTVASAVDFLDTLFQRGGMLDAKKNLSTSVLVVDDEFLSRRAVTHALEKAKLQSTDLDDPLAAVKLLAENDYDLVILDADMPGMNGFELCAKLRGLPRHKKTPVVFVTNLSGFDARANSTMAGANDFIAKPFLFVELAVKALVFVFRGRIESSKY